MKLFFHYCPYVFSNCYVIGESSPESKEALIIDPGSMDEHILGFIEENNFVLKGVLVTHDHQGHIQGLRTLRRIYNLETYAINQTIMGEKTTALKDGDTITAGGFEIDVISIPGHSSDSAVFKIGSMLFTGDALTAGMVGQTASTYGSTLQVNNLRSRILSLPGDYTIFPGHGPPSSLEAERRFNAGILRYDINRTRRPSFNTDVL